MIGQQVAVTATAKTIKDLIDTARGAGSDVSTGCTGVKLRYDAAETETVMTMETDPDGDAITATGAIVLSANVESLVSARIETFDISKMMLKGSGAVTVHVVVEQRSVGGR